jgi:hypothetical protein
MQQLSIGANQTDPAGMSVTFRSASRALRHDHWCACCSAPRDIFTAGIERVPRVVGISNGLPMLADQRVLMIHDVGRDAEYVAKLIAARQARAR